jgi:hypothetical protein
VRAGDPKDAAMITLTDMDETTAPSIAPVEQAIDVAHLRRMTLGEPSLEREVLQLFGRQADMLVARMRKAPPPVTAAAAHTLIGSARGIGAWRVVAAAEMVERVVAGGKAHLKPALAELFAAIDEAKVAIADLLRAR